MQAAEATRTEAGTTGSLDFGSGGEESTGWGMHVRLAWATTTVAARWPRTYSDAVLHRQPPGAHSRRLLRWHTYGAMRHRAKQHATVVDAPAQRHCRLAAPVVWIPSVQRAAKGRQHVHSGC